MGNCRFNLKNDADFYFNDHMFLTPVSITQDTQLLSSVITDA